MKIAMIGQKGIPAKFGGVERHVHELSVRLVKLGQNVIVYGRSWYTGRNDDFYFSGVEVKNIPTLHTKHLDTIIHSLLSTLDAMKEKVDVIHYHGVGPSLVSWLPKIFAPKIKVITTFHSIDRKHEKWNTLAKLILKLGEWTACKFADKTIAVSQTITQYCRDVYDIEAEFIPNGVPIFDTVRETTELHKWNLESQKYLLVLTRLIPHKGVHYAIEAFKKLDGTDLKLVIVGDGYYTDEYVRELKQMSSGNDNIIFTGFQSGETLNQLIAHARLMIHPSDNEGTPITVLEGMSHALPVLLSDIPEHLELISNKKFLFKKSNVEDLILKIKNILALSKQELEREGKLNKEFVSKNYNWDSIVSEINELYHESGERQTIGAIPLITD